MYRRPHIYPRSQTLCNLYNQIRPFRGKFQIHPLLIYIIIISIHKTERETTSTNTTTELNYQMGTSIY
jgi:hypothetical protein